MTAAVKNDVTVADVAIVGNGVLAMTLALALTREHPTATVALAGPAARKGCASLAAGAMLASFAEVEQGTLEGDVSRFKFNLGRKASKRWESWSEELNALAGNRVPFKIQFGTTVIHNAKVDELDDESFRAIVSALRQFDEPHEMVKPRDLPGYAPEHDGRALEAVHIPGEGYFGSRTLFDALEMAVAQQPRISMYDGEVVQVETGSRGHAPSVVLATGHRLSAAQVVLAAGARTQVFIDQIPELKSRVPRLFYGVGTGVVIAPPQLPGHCLRTANRGLACGLHVVPYAEQGDCYIGASNFISPVPEYHPRMTSLEALLKSSMEEVNKSFYKAQVKKVLVGHRPTSADTYPLIGPTSIDGLFVLSGTKRDGIHMSPLYADELARAMIEGRTCFEGRFAPERDLITTMSKEEGIKKAVAHLKSAAYQHELRLPKAGWDTMLDEMLRARVMQVYELCGIDSYGIPPELLDMYRYGHIAPRRSA